MTSVSQFLELDICDRERQVAGVMRAEITERPWLDERNQDALKEYILAVGGEHALAADQPEARRIRPGEMRWIPAIPTDGLAPRAIDTLPGIRVWQVRYFE